MTTTDNGPPVMATPEADNGEDHRPPPPPEAPPQRSLRVTRVGWWWLAVTVALWGIGLTKGINLLTLLACFLLASWVINGAVAGRRLRDLRLRRRLDAPLFAQTPARLEMEVENHGPGPVIAVSLQD